MKENKKDRELKVVPAEKKDGGLIRELAAKVWYEWAWRSFVKAMMR